MRFNVIEKEPDYCFSNFRNNLEGLLNAVMIGDSDTENRFYQPLTEIRENDSDYKINVQLPGVKKDDISVEVDKNSITISAESKFEDVKDDEYVHSSQFSYGKFKKTIELAKDIDENRSSVDYKDGVLKIILKKQEEKKEVRKLKIN